MTDRFVVDFDRGVSGTCLRDYITCSPMRLFELFGEPKQFGVGREYVFADTESGKCFTIYGRMCEDRFGREYSDIDWHSEEPYQFHIGGPLWASSYDFASWLRNKVIGVKEAA